MPSRLAERFRSQSPLQQAVTYGIGAGVLGGIIGGQDRGVAAGLATGLAVSLVAGLTRFAFRRRSADGKQVAAEAGIPWLRTLLFSLGFGGLIGAAALVTAAVKTERTAVFAEGMPDVVALTLALSAAVFVILVATFWWQDRKK